MVFTFRYPGQFLSLVLCIASVWTQYVTPPSNFFLDIDGISVAPGKGHLCVLQVKNEQEMGGKVQCYGEDHDRTRPPQDANYVQLSSGHHFTCGISVDQLVRCWGDIASREVPGLYTQISAAAKHGCGVKTDGHIACWGRLNFASPRLPGTDSKYTQVSCSDGHCCALSDKALVYCFGIGTAGEMNPPLHPPSRGKGGQGAVSAPHAGRGKEVVDDEEEEDAGRIGRRAESFDEDEYEDPEAYEDEEDAYEEVLEEIAETEFEIGADGSQLVKMQFKQISVSELYSCGITLLEGDLRCWGKLAHFGTHLVSHAAGPFKQVSAGKLGVCVIRSEDSAPSESGPTANTIQCWGTARSIVRPSDADVITPIDGAVVEEKPKSIPTAGFNIYDPTPQFPHTVEQAEWDQVNVGASTICAVTMNSGLHCWGNSVPLLKKIPKDVIIA